MKYIILFLSFITITATAKVVDENLTVEKAKWNEKKKLYRLSFSGKAGVYYADRKHLECIRLSIKNVKPVKISFDTKTLVVHSCDSKGLK